ncbi:glycosyltransferase [Turicibacter sanguinis]|nr:glycosyltransferase [Turicibacter sanguinis]MTP47655.1 glycosyltransferase [Turicibacter sanguinis]MTP49502.1 glycosyltransferase [Turicibacter sanguinis]MTQ06933.1 glycosyltransferase [Turicibacter sanguinis]
MVLGFCLERIKRYFKNKKREGIAMKIGIIIPAYQAESTIIRCISSLAQQTFQAYEIIVIDDGSTDSTPQLLERLSQQVSNLIVIHQQNMGAIDARLNGIQLATGDYVLFIDSDDWISSNALELLNQIAEVDQSDVILFHAYLVSGQAGYPFNLYKPNCELVIMNPLKAFFNREIGGYICGKMIKLSFIQDKGIQFPHDSSYGEDVAMFYSIFMHNPSISCCNEYLYYYVKTTKVIPSYCLDIMKSIEFIGEQLKCQGLYKEYEDDYQLLGTRYFIETYNQIQDNQELQTELFILYKTWNKNHFLS